MMLCRFPLSLQAFFSANSYQIRKAIPLSDSKFNVDSENGVVLLVNGSRFRAIEQNVKSGKIDNFQESSLVMVIKAW